MGVSTTADDQDEGCVVVRGGEGKGKGETRPVLVEITPARRLCVRDKSSSAPKLAATRHARRERRSHKYC